MVPLPAAPGTVTVMVAGVTFATFVVAVITVVPGAKPVTWKFTPPEFWTIVVPKGTCKTAPLLELSVTGTPPAGATTESESGIDCTAPALTGRFCCAKLNAAPTVATPVPGP